MNRKKEKSDLPQDDTGEGMASDLADDRLYRALASTQRRRLLYILRENGEHPVEELATILAGWEATDTGMMASSEDRRRRLLELRHRDIPMLADAGLVEHDREGGTVSPKPLPEPIAELAGRAVDVDSSVEE